MHDIKYRGICKSENKWLYGYLHKVGKQFVIQFETGNWLPVQDNTIGQYIGQKDKQGNMIYQGDIINIGQDESFIIERLDRTTSWVMVGSDTGKIRRIETVEQFTNEWHLNINEGTIAGNIY